MLPLPVQREGKQHRRGRPPSRLEGGRAKIRVPGRPVTKVQLEPLPRLPPRNDLCYVCLKLPGDGEAALHWETSGA